MMQKKSKTTVFYLLLLVFTINACKTQKAVLNAPPPTPKVISDPAPIPEIRIATNLNKNMVTSDTYSGSYPKVDAGKFDNGKMWTFSYAPKQYFKETYGFEPSEEWLESVRKSALRFATYCTASFVSSDGLVMTNHHCGRQSVTEATRTGEDLPTDGFYASTLADERKVPSLFVDQLILMKDVTNIIENAISLKPADKKSAAIKEASDNLISEYKKSTGLEIQIHTFYNGSIYQMYGYKRYNDVRLVMAPESDLGFFGGDPDNFTYPRYCLDYTFFRVYDEFGKPLKTKDYFTWSDDGPKGQEPTFVIGNPGTTKRLNTVAGLEYDRDYSIPNSIAMSDNVSNTLWDYIEKNPSSKLELMDQYFSAANGAKAYKGIERGLKDPTMMGKRADFEHKFKEAVQKNPTLNSKYGAIWKNIATSKNKLSKFFGKQIAFSPTLYNSEYFKLSSKIISLAEEFKLPQEYRKGKLSDEELKKKLEDLKLPANLKLEIENKYVIATLAKAFEFLGSKHPILENVTFPFSLNDYAQQFLKKTILNDPQKIKELFKTSPDQVFQSNDPFLKYAKMAHDSLKYYQSIINPIKEEENSNIQKLGQAYFDVYGTNVPPDANFTLRIADGIVKNYQYNGTEAPEFTTFYGLYDRYYSYGQKAPWDLPKKWQNPPNDLK